MTITNEEQQVPLYTISADITEKNEKHKTIPTLFIKNVCRRLHEHSGIWYILTANILLTCCTFVLKLIPADMFDIMLIRFLLQSVVFGAFASFYKHYNVFNTNGQPIACALNMFMSSVSILSYLAAFYFLPLSDLNTIKYTYIVWTAILSVIFFRDRFKIVNGIALFLTFVGLIFATKPHFFFKRFSHIFDHPSITPSNTTISALTTTTNSSYYYLGIGIASFSALTKAIQMIARKQLIQTKQPYAVMNFQFTGSAFIVTLIYTILRRFWQPEPYPWKWMGSVGVAIGCIQVLTNTFVAKALKRENVQLIAILGSLDIVYAVVLQYIFFRQTKSWIFYIGALLIVSSAIILSVDRYLSNKPERQKQAINGKKHKVNSDV